MGFRRATIAGLCAAALACYEGTPTAGCDLCTTSATVAGTVRDSTGAPAADVSVQPTVYTVDADSCGFRPLDLIPSGHAPSFTDSTGRYAEFLRSASAPFPACIGVTAIAIMDTAYRADTLVAGKPLAFRADYPAGGAHDTLVVDLVLRHR